MRGVIGALLLVGGVGCSSSGSPSGSTSSSSGTLPAEDGGTASSSGSTSTSSSSSTSSTSSTSSSGGDPVAACIAACESKHPKGVTLGKGIDSCWSKSCPTECSNIGTGKDQLPDHGSCKNVVGTPAALCSQCTVDHCCTAWDACFDDADCTALNTCTNACYN